MRRAWRVDSWTEGMREVDAEDEGLEKICWGRSWREAAEEMAERRKVGRRGGRIVMVRQVDG